MAKRGRPPTSKTVADLDEGLRREIDQAVDSQANESTRSIYNRFGLAQRGLNFETFRKYVSTRRLARVRTDAEPATLDKVPDWDELDQWARRYAMERLHAGDAKVYELLLVSRGKREADKAKIEERIDQRAAEKHAAWKTEHERKQTAALEAMQGEAPGLTPELLAQIKSRVLGI